MNYNRKTGLTVTLIASSSVACGALLCLAVWIIGRLTGCTYDTQIYFAAYISGSIGFLLTAPVNLIKPIISKHEDNTDAIATSWAFTTIGLFLLACLVGLVFMFINKWKSGITDPASLANGFISGAFLLFVSGGIYWLFYRKKNS